MYLWFGRQAAVAAVVRGVNKGKDSWQKLITRRNNIFNLGSKFADPGSFTVRPSMVHLRRQRRNRSVCTLFCLYPDPSPMWAEARFLLGTYPAQQQFEILIASQCSLWSSFPPSLSPPTPHTTVHGLGWAITMGAKYQKPKLMRLTWAKKVDGIKYCIIQFFGSVTEIFALTALTSEPTEFTRPQMPLHCSYFDSHRVNFFFSLRF